MIKFTSLFLFLLSLMTGTSHANNFLCDVHAGMSDSNVLALSSQPGFCQTYGYEAGKRVPESEHEDDEGHDAICLVLVQEGDAGDAGDAGSDHAH